MQSKEGVPLSDEDIRSILGPKIHVITYPQLTSARSIVDIFDP
jgi:hypothetical protein